MVVCDSRALALECTETMTPSYGSTSSSQADIPNCNYSTGPTDPDPKHLLADTMGISVHAQGRASLDPPHASVPSLLLVQSFY